MKNTRCLILGFGLAFSAAAVAADIEGQIFAALGMSREPLRQVDNGESANGQAEPSDGSAARGRGAIAQAA